ncbi:MAG TPA: T9SS type A sorting domain-containing protein [Lacibacter sp.]|nr:T9SS type A sorting domain-containing protein [Lacibacter sp.]HMO87805.1 T9SS type A sorting domain-containing protein [Lacibacter sp.]
MKKILFLALFITGTTLTGNAQTNFEGFENASFATVASGGFGFTQSGASIIATRGRITGSTGFSDRPASINYAATGSGAYAVSWGDATLTSADLSTVGATFVALRFRLMAVSLLFPTDGVDAADYVRVSISPNGGTTWWNTLEVRGNDDNWWSYAATGIAQGNYDGDNSPTVISASGTANSSTHPSTVIVRGLPTGITNLRVRIELVNSGIFERWVIDNVELIRTSGGPLPVNFANVSAKALASNVEVKWSNLTESDISHYNVERSSDGQNFKVIGTIQPRANDFSSQNYTFVDPAPEKTNFYRIKAVEFNATTKSSVILRVSSEFKKKDFHVYPNPVQGGVFTLQAGDVQPGMYFLQLFSNNGQRVFSRNLQFQGGAVSQSLELPGGLKPGMYLLQVDGNGTRSTTTLFIQ